MKIYMRSPFRNITFFKLNRLSWNRFCLPLVLLIGLFTLLITNGAPLTINKVNASSSSEILPREETEESEEARESLIGVPGAAHNDDPPLDFYIDALGNQVTRDQIKSFEQVAKQFKVEVEPKEAKAGQTVTLKVRIEPIFGFWTYPLDQPGSKTNPEINQVNQFRVTKNPVLIEVEPFKDPAGSENHKVDNSLSYLVYAKETLWEQKYVVAPGSKIGEIKIDLRPKINICDNRNCYFTNRKLSIPLTIIPGKVDIDAKYAAKILSGSSPNPSTTPNTEGNTPKNNKDPLEPANSKSGTGNTTPNRQPQNPLSSLGVKHIDPALDYQKRMDDVLAQLSKQKSNPVKLFTFLSTAAFWGLITLLTPCVFPMIPITVSYFIKQGEKAGHNPLRMALVYTVTIVIVLSIASITLLSVFRQMSVNPWMNVGLGSLFIFFALSLFGMYELAVPSFLSRSATEMEGKGGYLGTIFMAISFTMVSFSCVAPFLGGFSGMAASGNFSIFELILGGLVFSSTFAAPFLFLALFPSLMKKLPRSGSWMNVVKTIMGFLELAAALKFYRTAELRWTSTPQFMTYDFVLTIWIILLFLAGFYLLNLFRLPHDDPQEHISVGRMLFATICLTLAIYFLPALFAKNPEGEKQRPAGLIFSWVDAFLLPDPTPAELVKAELAWSSDLFAVVEDARRNDQLIFIDFTGVTCTNCKLNEKNIFSKSEFKELLGKYMRVQMYTDTIPETLYMGATTLDLRDDQAKINLEFQKKAFGTEQLPLYVILKPTKENTIERIGVYDEGKINDEKAFLKFLSTPLENK